VRQTVFRRPERRPLHRHRRLAGRSARWGVGLLLLLALAPGGLAGPSPVRADETVALKLVVNGEAKGQVAVVLSPARRVAMRVADLRLLGANDLSLAGSRLIGGTRYLDLDHLFPRVTYFLDASQTLNVTVGEAGEPEAEFAPPRHPPLRRVIMDVTVNTAPVGTRIFYLTAANRPLLRFEDVQALGVTGLDPAEVTRIDGDPYLLLDTLYPSVHYQVDTERAALIVTIHPSRLPTTRLDTGPRADPNAVHLDETGAFFNYSADYVLGENAEFAALTVPLEAGARTLGGLLFTNGLFTRRAATTRDEFVRQDTRATWDDTRHLVRYRLGDFVASGRQLGGGARMAGLSIRREYAISPYFIRYPGLSLSGTLETPSEVSVYVNDVLVRRDHLPPGDFVYDNLPRATGAGRTELVIVDAFGRERRVEAPFYVSPLMLRSGQDAFSYDIGVRRKAFGVESFEYGGPVFVGFHQHGFGRDLTMGGRLEADGDVVNGGPLARMVLGRSGELDLALALSRADRRDGRAYLAAYTYSGSVASLLLSTTHRSRDYAHLALAPSEDKISEEWRASVGLHRAWLGSLSVSRVLTRLYLGVDRTQTSLFYNHRVTSRGVLFLRASRTDAATTEDQVFAGVTFTLGGGTSISADVQQREERPTRHAALRRNAPLGPGWGYRLEGTQGEDAAGETAADGNAFLEYRGPWGVYKADARTGPGGETYVGTAAGAVVATGGRVFATRPVNDGFAVVRVPDVPDVKVYYSNTLVGRTNGRGELAVPNLISYVDNRLSIDDADVPINFEIADVRRSVSIPYRGAGTVTFPVRRLQGFKGVLHARRLGVEAPIEFARITLRVGDETVPGLVGRGGVFYLENLAPGTYPATAVWKRGDCRFKMVIPKSDRIVVDLGKVVCEAK
jgi:outer membrane usher protein